MDFTNLKNFMDDMAQSHTPGNGIIVYLGGKKVFEYTAGYSDLENKCPLKGDEQYFIYSVSKPATVTAGIQLLEKGKFLLSDPLYEYIPEFKHMTVDHGNGILKEAANPITIGDLFTMTSGFSYDNKGAIDAAKTLSANADTHTVIKCLAETPLNFEPGTHWQYGLSHDILADLISVISGMRFSDYMKKYIFEPLGMKHTGYHLTDEIAAKMAEQYEFVPDSGAVCDLVDAQRCGNAKNGSFVNKGKTNPFVFTEQYESGGAGVITTLSDYALFAAALANNGTGINGERILSPRSVALMKTNRLNPDLLKDFNWKQLDGYGYGLGVRTMMDPSAGSSLGSVGEFGWGGAAGASLWADTSINLGVFYVQHCLNPREEYYQPRIRNVIYSGL